MSLTKGHAVALVQVIAQGSYVLQLHFNDGHIATVDFGPFLRRSRNPQIRQFLDRARFQSFMVRDGNLIWGDYDLCFAIENLYVGTVDTRTSDTKPVLAVAEAHAAYNVKPIRAPRRTKVTTQSARKPRSVR